MAVSTGALVFVTIDYVRSARYRTRHQTESHRTRRYRVRYQLEGQPTHEAMVGPNPRQYLVAHIRESQHGDIVEVTLAEDGSDSDIVDWANITRERLMEDFDETWGESD
ncbi:hypothetical protein V4C53_23525 [Paraburkholderia azotifigens]|uniref:hypothetical protein n=1 Tax=Paraburkholderia azotifigens TaxID=2057004 RepID=UPI00316CADB7